MAATVNDRSGWNAAVDALGEMAKAMGEKADAARSPNPFDPATMEEADAATSGWVLEQAAKLLRERMPAPTPADRAEIDNGTAEVGKGAGPVGEAEAWLARAHTHVRLGRVIGLHEEIVRRDADSLFGPGNYDLLPLYARPVEEPGEVEAALRELEASCEAMVSVRSQSTYLHIESDPGARDALTRLDNARRRARAALTGDAQEPSR